MVCVTSTQLMNFVWAAAAVELPVGARGSILPRRCFVDQFVVVLVCLKARRTLAKNLLHQIPIIFHTAGMKNCQNRYLLD